MMHDTARWLRRPEVRWALETEWIARPVALGVYRVLIWVLNNPVKAFVLTAFLVLTGCAAIADLLIRLTAAQSLWSVLLYLWLFVVSMLIVFLLLLANAGLELRRELRIVARVRTSEQDFFRSVEEDFDQLVGTQ